MGGKIHHKHCFSLVLFRWHRDKGHDHIKEQGQNIFAVKNTYQVLAEENNSGTVDKFVEAKKETMEECLPKKTQSMKSLRSSDARVTAARLEAQQAQGQYEASNSEEERKTRNSGHELYTICIKHIN